MPVSYQTIGADDDGQRFDRWFKKVFPAVPYGALQKLLRTGQIRVDGKRAQASTRLEAGQKIRIPPLPERDDEAPGDRPRKSSVSDEDTKFIRSLVIHDDEGLEVINKPAGLAVQGGSGTYRHVDGMLDALVDEDGVRPRLVHRLDKDTSGLLLLAGPHRRPGFWGICSGATG